MATGKSTVGRALGRRLDASLVDMDRAIKQKYRQEISEIFARLGEAAFRAAETDLLMQLVAEQDLKDGVERRYPRRYVLSTGGGVPLREDNIPLLKQIGHIVWLRARTETIASRCRAHIAKRPLLAGHEDDLEQHIDSLTAQRDRYYEAIADTTLWTDDINTPEQIATRIKRLLTAEATECRSTDQQQL